MAGINPSTASFTEADGRQLAVDMMAEMRQWLHYVDARECEKLGDDAGEDAPDMHELMLNEEPTILRRYLATVASSKSLGLERGFYAVLTLAIAHAADELVDETADEYIEPRPGLVWSAKS